MNNTLARHNVPFPKRGTHRRGPSRVDDDEFAAMLGLDSILSEHEPVIYLHGPVDGGISSKVIRALGEIEHVRKSPLAIIDLNTPGGDVSAMSAILSAMRGTHMKIATYNSSEASSAGSVILSAGEKGMRFSSPFSHVMIHEMLCWTPMEPVEDTRRRIEFIAHQNDAMMEFLAKNCGKTVKYLRKLIKDSDGRDLYLTPEQALELGIIDHIGIPKFETNVELGLTAVK